MHVSKTKIRINILFVSIFLKSMKCIHILHTNHIIQTKASFFYRRLFENTDCKTVDPSGMTQRAQGALLERQRTTQGGKDA